MLDADTTARIVGYINGTVDIVLQRAADKAKLFLNAEVRSAGNGAASPFMKLLFPQVKVASLIERSLSASIGTTFNYIAREIVRAVHGNGDIEYELTGELPREVVSTIDDLISRYRGESHASPNTPAELEILRAIPRSGAALVRRHVKSDVRYVDRDGVEHYIEIKTPMPNYDTCKAVKARILTIHALRYPTSVRAVAAFPHNPNGVAGEYAWPPPRYFLDPNHDWAINGTSMMGSAFWNYIGGSADTYRAVCEAFAIVAEQRANDILEVLDIDDGHRT
jgi:hypothetical protein